MMAQISDQWFDFTVLDTVLMGRYSKRRGALASETSADVKAAGDCLRMVEMFDKRHDSITWLSGGQRQRVMLARAFAQEPQIIVLDEPTNHLDLKHQVELLEYLREWVTAGERAVIQVMHDINFARRYSDRILLMDDGKLTGDDTPEKIMSNPGLDEAYGFNVRGFMEQSLRLWEETKNG
jgi:iron complex transport system ATP-binding protein